MTVTALSPRLVRYAGDGGSGPFAVPFRFLEAGDLKLELTDADGAQTPVTAALITGAGEASGGAVTTPSPVAPGQTLTIWTETALVQPADYITADAFPAETHEAALDRLTLIAQDHRRDQARTLTAPLGETPGPLPDAATRKGMLLTFDPTTGDPVTDRPYAAFVEDVAGAIDGVAVAVGVVEAAGAVQRALVTEAGEGAVDAIQSEGVNGLEVIEAAVEAGAAALGFPMGGIIDVVSPEAGFDEGWAFVDEFGWTTPPWYTANAGTVGSVIRLKIAGASFSGLPDAFRIVEPPPVLPYDINIIVISGQSNSEDADSVPMLPRTPSDMVQMLDSTRPRHFVGAFGLTGFSQAVGDEYVASQSHWGGNLAPAVGDMLEKLIEEVNGKPFIEHGRTVVPVHIGMSSSSMSQISYGTAHFSAIQTWFTAAKAVADSLGKSIGIIAGAHLWGADAYDTAIGEPAARAAIHNYWKAGGDVHAHLQQAILGLTYDFSVGIVGSHAHVRNGFDIDPFVANAEAYLCATYPSKYSMVNGEGQFFLNGRNRGFAGSSVHHSALDAALIGAHIGWFVHETVSLGHGWNSCIPAISRTGAAQVTFSGLPDTGWAWDFHATGLAPTGAVANHGWFFFDPSSPAAEVPLLRPPYPGPGVLVADFTATLPVNLSVRYGARAAGSVIAGNDIWKRTSPPIFTINGSSYELHRNVPAFSKVIP